MKAEVTRACGHQEVVAIYGAYKSRPRQLEYEATKVCRACWEKQQKEKAASQLAEANAVIEQIGLPVLEGSPKQVAWAMDIRAKRMARLIKEYRDNGYGPEVLVERWGKDPKAAFVVAAFCEPSAKRWIDTQHEDLLDFCKQYAK